MMMRPPHGPPRGPGGRRPPHGRRSVRTRTPVGPGEWEVHARVERFVEPVLLLLLSERPMHGYELLERVPELSGDDRRVDLGNLYRLLRSLEEEGIVTSEWDSGVPGPAKRVYALTDAGRGLLDRWATALGEARALITTFLDRHGKGVST
ncbi:MAG: PadR family transcriptional regulator [Thermoleophilia bacterium]